MTAPKLRLVKVAVQPVFVLDNGETITEVDHQATVIPASEWSDYSNVRFPRELAEWQKRIDAEHEAM
jgi:protoheme ferro-lyase